MTHNNDTKDDDQSKIKYVTNIDNHTIINILTKNVNSINVKHQDKFKHITKIKYVTNSKHIIEDETFIKIK